jgi:hypothetical protein
MWKPCAAENYAVSKVETYLHLKSFSWWGPLRIYNITVFQHQLAKDSLETI